MTLLSEIPERYCQRCGRKMITREVNGRFDERTGKKKTEVEQVCPRWDRSWRNLWAGGIGHEGRVYYMSRSGHLMSLTMEWRP